MESSLIAPHLAHVSVEGSVDHRLANDPVRAKSQENRCGETGLLGDLEIHVEGILVAVQAIEQRLLGQSRRLDHTVRVTVRRLVTRLRSLLAADPPSPRMKIDMRFV